MNQTERTGSVFKGNEWSVKATEGVVSGKKGWLCRVFRRGREVGMVAGRTKDEAMTEAGKLMAGKLVGEEDRAAPFALAKGRLKYMERSRPALVVAVAEQLMVGQSKEATMSCAEDMESVWAEKLKVDVPVTGRHGGRGAPAMMADEAAGKVYDLFTAAGLVVESEEGAKDTRKLRRRVKAVFGSVAVGDEPTQEEKDQEAVFEIVRKGLEKKRGVSHR